MSTRIEEQTKQRRRFVPLGVIFGVVGLALFAYFVSRVGVSEILDGIGRLGVGFLLVLAISSIRHIVRSVAWTRCVEAPYLSLIHISEPTRLLSISYAVFCLKKKK